MQAGTQGLAYLYKLNPKATCTYVQARAQARTYHSKTLKLVPVCRQERKPFLLIDFSDFLQINVYYMGATYQALLKLLRLEDHPSFQRPTDPSLYINRYADKLNFGRDSQVRAGRLNITLLYSYALYHAFNRQVDGCLASDLAPRFLGPGSAACGQGACSLGASWDPG